MTDERTSPLRQLREMSAGDAALEHIHLIGPHARCGTEDVGHATPGGQSMAEIVVDASEGFIPLWVPGVVLRWRFATNTLQQFADPGAAGAAIEALLAEALLTWGDAAPVRFSKNEDIYDFEIEVKSNDDCNPKGCVLASAFFPDAGRHTLELYPILFHQSHPEQVKTLTHELGHVFGLRHFFAQLREADAPSELFGKQDAISIMNYGDKCSFTPDDKADLKRLYQMVWSGQLKAINKTPIRQVRPFHDIPVSDGSFAIAAAHA